MKRWTLALIIALGGCTPAWQQVPHDQPIQREVERSVPTPSVDADQLKVWDFMWHAGVERLARVVSPGAWLDALMGPAEALDVNGFDEVLSSGWYVNGRGFDLNAIRRGPNRLGGPAAGALKVVRGKTEGLAPGLVLKDTQGALWFVKFDPPANPELSSGAEMVAARALYAAGYHVPETYLVALNVGRLVLEADAWTHDPYRRRVPMTAADLRALLTQLNVDEMGQVRAVFSRGVPGKILGPFSYRGRRVDDLNDTVPHERRRSLRGLWLFNAWLNNTDTGRHNTLDTWLGHDYTALHTRMPRKALKDIGVVLPGDEAPRWGHVRHYLIDFGDALGAKGHREKHISEGYEHRVDLLEMGKRLLALGQLYPYWLAVRRSPLRSVGVFEAEAFEPARWRTIYPNPAFERATGRDTLWAGLVLARFTPLVVRALVSTARYSDQDATDLVVRVLLARRRKLLRYAFDGWLPLHELRTEGARVRMVDAAVSAGVLTSTGYRWRLDWVRVGAPDVELAEGTSATPEVDLTAALSAAGQAYGRALSAAPFLALRWTRLGETAEVEVRLRRLPGDRLLPVGLKR